MIMMIAGIMILIIMIMRRRIMGIKIVIRIIIITTIRNYNNKTEC